MNPSKATGYDSLPPRLLKMCAPALVDIITKLANRIISEGTFPNALKKAEVSPIFKNNSKFDKTNYRPISILPCINILIEKLINSQLQDFTNIIFHENISAYRKCHNTQSVILRAVEDWKSSLDKRQHVAAVSMDLSKAFDVLPHGLLVAKLNAYGITCKTLTIFCNYLSNRTQRVKINNVKSNWCSVNKGVPQGSVLGPVLFNIFINDIFYFVNHCQIYNYADDNVISYYSKSLAELKSVLEFDISNLLNWFSENGMKANPSKFQLISFGNTNLNEVNIGNTVIQSQPCIKYLGVLIDNKLSFVDHVVHICSKASRQVNALLRLSNLLDQDTKLTLYKAFISSNYDYCPVVWSFCNRTLLNKLCKLQRRALRFVVNDYESEYDELLNKCNTIKVSSLFIVKIAIEMFKVAKNMSPPFVLDLFQYQSNGYSLRNSTAFLLKSPNTTRYGKLCFVFLGIKIWNELPPYAREICCPNAFKDFIYKYKVPSDIWFYC
jgi:hypothetical protein